MQYQKYIAIKNNLSKNVDRLVDCVDLCSLQIVYTNLQW